MPCGGPSRGERPSLRVRGPSARAGCLPLASRRASWNAAREVLPRLVPCASLRDASCRAPPGEAAGRLHLAQTAAVRLFQDAKPVLGGEPPPLWLRHDLRVGQSRRCACPRARGLVASLLNPKRGGAEALPSPSSSSLSSVFTFRRPTVIKGWDGVSPTLAERGSRSRGHHTGVRI